MRKKKSVRCIVLLHHWAQSKQLPYVYKCVRCGKENCFEF